MAAGPLAGLIFTYKQNIQSNTQRNIQVQ